MPLRTYIIVTLLAMCLSITACGNALLIPPQQVIRDPMPTATATFTETPMPVTATSTATLIATMTPTATATPTPTPNPETFLPTTPQAAPNCGVTMIKGEVRSDARLLNGIPIHVWWEGSDGVYSLPSGEDPTKPDGYWDVVLDARAKAGRWYVAAISLAGIPLLGNSRDPVTKAHLSPAVTVETDELPCAPESDGRQVITVDFVLNDPSGLRIGEAGPTLTPTPTPSPTLTPTPFPTPDGQNRTVQVPILMYHYISTPPPGADRLRRDLSVSPEAFRTHMAYLQERGYQPISIHNLIYALTRGAPLPPNPIIITFDDGYRDNYDNAFPILKEFGFRGTFFVLTERVDRGDQRYMTWDHLREMQAAGMEIGSHARSHVDLRRQSDEGLIWQILGSREAIEGNLGVRPEVFSYPSGRYTQRAMEIVRSAHYWAAVTTSGGIIHSTEDRFALERVRVRGGWGPADLQRALTYWIDQGE